MRRPALGAILVVASAACGGLLHTDDGIVEPADASSLEASPDSTSTGSVGDDATAADSSVEASPSPEASAGDATDAGDASNASDAIDAGDSTADSSTIEAAKPYSTCIDACALGDQECSLLPQVCTYDDAGHTVACEPQGQGIWTCALADTGCTVWAGGVTCKPDVPCCATCQDGICPLGSVGEPCEQDTDCASDACDVLTRACVSHQCADHRQDGEESDVDCGGPLCDACRGGQRCHSSFDCLAGHYCMVSRVCSGGGGPIADASASDAAPCADECAVGDQDCSRLPQVCAYDDAGFTASCEAPGEGIWTCIVGSAGCAVWTPGAACASSASCCSGCEQVACDAGPDSLCWSCPPVSIGKPCEQDTDCVSDACDAVRHECISDPCADHRQDGLETDVDCGGPDCNPCQAGQWCQSNLDCLRGQLCLTNGYGRSCT